VHKSGQTANIILPGHPRSAVHVEAYCKLITNVPDSRIGLDDMLVGSESECPRTARILQILTVRQETSRTSSKIPEEVTTAEIEDFALTIE
jgi:hypothetical protein